MAVDYDPGASRINQENRIKLMLANAKMQQEAAEAADKTMSVEENVDQKEAVFAQL